MSCSNSRAVMGPPPIIVARSWSKFERIRLAPTDRPDSISCRASAPTLSSPSARNRAKSKRSTRRSTPSDTLPAAAFDLVHARLVLIVLRRPPSKSNPGRTQPRHRIRAAVNYDSSRTRRPHKLWSEDSCSCRGRTASKPKLRPGC
jgi:hypothetical protein